MTTTWFTDQAGNKFTTTDNRAPSAPNIPVTIADGTGRIGNGTFNGTTANSSKNSGS